MRKTKWTFADLDTEKMTKRVFTTPFIIVLSILVVMTILTVFLCISNVVLKQEIHKKEASISSLNEKIEFLDSQSDALQSQINYYQDFNEDILSVYRFYYNNAACVDNHSNYYHKYDCSDFDSSSFWIFNKEYAQDKGYKPCPKCWN